MGFKYFLPVKDELNGIFYGRNKNKLTFYNEALSIVTSGLILNLDAGNSSSYPGSGTTWTDLSGSGNNGTLVNGPTYSSADGGSIVFDGTNDLVTTTLTSGTSFTWCCWFKTDVLSNGYRNIISIRTNNYMLMLLDDNTNYLGFWSPDAFTTGSTLNTPQLSTNTWYFVTFVREGNNVTSGYKAYLNGSFSGSANTGTWSSSDPIIIGGRTDTSQYLNGNISNVQIYNRALSASEVAQNYNALKDRFAATVVTSGLQLYLDAGNSSSYPGSGTTWYDLSGNNNNGTLVNGPTYSSANGGCIVLDGSNDYVQFSTISAQTICFFGKLDTDAPTLAALVATTATTDGALRSNPVGNLPYTTNSDDFHNGYSSSVMINGSSNLSQNTQTNPNSFVIPNNRDLFDDFYVGAIGNSRNVSTISHNFLGRAFKGRVYVVLIYNRQLSNSELLENFNVFKSRYGL